MQNTSRPLRTWPAAVSAVATSGLVVTLMAIYWQRPDALAAVTVYPPWIWLIPGFALWLGTLRLPARWPLMIAALWLVFLASTNPSPRSLVREIGHSDPEAAPPSQVLDLRCRVLTLNCGGVGLRAEEISLVAPDLVLLQEPPGREQLERLTSELFAGQGEVESNGDTAILARGTVRPLDLNIPHGHFFTAAEVRFDGGRECIVVSLRLEPYPVRFDFWRGDYWRSYTAVRKKQRQQTTALIPAASTAAGNRPIVLAGDFNAPPGDPIFVPLAPRLRDVFPPVGVGGGNTMTNDYPLLRIDYIWASSELAPQFAWVRPSKNSDHRGLTCDLSWPDRRP